MMHFCPWMASDSLALGPARYSISQKVIHRLFSVSGEMKMLYLATLYPGTAVKSGVYLISSIVVVTCTIIYGYYAHADLLWRIF